MAGAVVQTARFLAATAGGRVDMRGRVAESAAAAGHGSVSMEQVKDGILSRMGCTSLKWLAALLAVMLVAAGIEAGLEAREAAVAPASLEDSRKDAFKFVRQQAELRARGAPTALLSGLDHQGAAPVLPTAMPAMPQPADAAATASACPNTLRSSCIRLERSRAPPAPASLI